jgi:hypothetical protein
VPIQAVVERQGAHYCVRRTGNSVEPSRVHVGSTNEKFLVIRQGLMAGDEVLLDPRSHLSRANLDEVAPLAAPEEGQAHRADSQSDAAHGSATDGDSRS